MPNPRISPPSLQSGGVQQVEVRRDGRLKGVPGTDGSLRYLIRLGFLVLAAF